MDLIAKHRTNLAKRERVRVAMCTGRMRTMRIFKTLSRSALIGAAATVVLVASATAMAAGWTRADLTAIAGAPHAAGNPAGYTTDLAGQGPVARVVYRTSSGHV